MDLRQYLTSKGIEWKEVYRSNGGTNAVFNCPVCGDKEEKFAINIATGAFNCLHENNCGIKGGWGEFLKLFNDDYKPLDGAGMFSGKVQKTYQIPKPKTFKMPSNEALKFLTDRGFNEDTITKFKLAMTDDGKTIAMPFYKNGKLTNVKYRSIDGKKMWQERDAEPTLFNRDNIPEDAKSLIITEGELDCAAFGQYGIDAVSMHGGASNLEWIENEWEWLNRFKEIILCFDMDTAGQSAVYEASKRLGEWRCRRLELPHKDANDCLKAGVPLTEILECLKNLKDFSPEILVSAKNFTEEVVSLIEDPKRLNGFPTAFHGLNDILGGWRGSELTIWSGMNGSGKSTILNQILIDIVTHGIGACVASLEMPAARYLRWAVVQYTGLQYPSADRVRESLNLLGRRLYVVNTHEEIDIDTLLDVFRYAVRRYGCKHFVIDSLMRLKMDSRKKELQEQKDICTKLVSFAKEFDVHAHLVAHPRKGYDDDDRPGKVDVSGASEITNLAHNVLIMWRPSEDLKEKAKQKKKPELIPDAKLYIKKNRELGTEGSIKLWFDPNSKLFSDKELS